MIDDRSYYQKNRKKILLKRALKRRPMIEQERKIKEITLNMDASLLVKIVRDKMKTENGDINDN